MMKRTVVLLILFAAFSGNAIGKETLHSDLATDTTETVAKFEVSGVILEKGTRAPLEKITFFIKEKNLSVMTDKDGEFRFEIEPGKYTAIIPVVGYQKLEEKFEVVAGKENRIVFRPLPNVVNPYRIVVRSEKKKTEVSAQRVDIREAAVIPGTNRDVVKAITNLPGVNSLTVFNGYGSGLIIRGSSWEDSGYYVNDQWIPMLYHFGGFESIFEPELVDSIDYSAGGFSPEYGEAMGGIVRVNIRDPRTDRFGGYANLSLLSASCMVEGPLSEKDSAAIAVKRGFLDLYTRIIESEFEDELSFTTYPEYFDASLIYKRDMDSLGEFKLIGIGANDRMELVIDDEDVSGRFSNTISNEIRFFNLIGEWQYKNGPFKSTFSPMVGFDEFTLDQGPRAFFETKDTQYSLYEKLEYRLGKSHRLQGGIRLVGGKFAIESSYFAPMKEGEVSYDPYDKEINDDQDINYFFPSVYVMDTVEWGDFTVTPGVYFLYDEHNSDSYADPRLSAKYRLTDTITLKSATGYYSMMPQPDECYAPWGTEGLSPERSVHAIAGFEKKFTEEISVDIQGYYKDFTDMVVRIDENDPTVYGNEGEGHAYGAEVLLRHKMTDKFFGWLAYSYCVSKRKDGEDKPERYFDMDITHNLTAVAAYKLNRYWQFSARFNYTSGAPYTDLLGVETMYDVDNDEYTPVYSGPINEERMPARHQLDLRVDKYWLFDNWILSTYLDIQNAYMNENVMGHAYTEDYTEREEFTMLPIMITLGLKGDF